MKKLFLLCAIFLLSYQAETGNAQDADTLSCVQNGGGCTLGACRPPSVPAGTCRSGALNCCKW
uniref:Beta-defensin-like domain-containing protein n=1 Tax=Salvator merianae TaxID=96440 RepID=A0A8D0B950_SALMN